MSGVSQVAIARVCIRFKHCISIFTLNRPEMKHIRFKVERFCCVKAYDGL